MFDPKFNDVRQIIAQIQSDVDQYGVLLNTVNTREDGPGLNPEQIHALFGYTVAGVHNLALALGHVVDALDTGEHTTS